MSRPKKAKKEEPLPPFPNEFMEQVLSIRDTDQRRFALFSTGLKLSARIYEQQRDSARTLRKKVAA